MAVSERARASAGDDDHRPEPRATDLAPRARGAGVAVPRRRSPGSILSRAIGVLVAVPAGIVMVLVPAIGQRLLLVDPLRAPTDRGSRWVTRVRRPSEPRSPRSADPAANPLPRRHRWRRAMAVPLTLLLLAFGVSMLVVNSRGLDTDVPPALADAEWWPEYQQTMKWILFHRFRLHDPKVGDVRSPHINVEGGVRRSWSPPACDCRRVRVWMFGGSTTFGIGQRDEHTIASELARVAWDHGIAVDIENRGVPGEFHWIEALSYAWQAAGPDRPDLVIFYDGANDLGNAMTGDGTFQPIDSTVRAVEEDQQRNWPLKSFFLGLFGNRPPPGVEAPEEPVHRHDLMTPEEVGRLGVQIYERSRSLSKAVASELGITTWWFWQPVKSDHGRIPGEPIQEAYEWGIEMRRGARAALPDDVVDLTDAFDDVPEPVFYDGVHHNELGARVLGEALFAHLEEDLRRLSSS